MSDTSITSLQSSLRLAKALQLSRRGKMAEAQDLLCGENTIPEGNAELHALAALVTNQGDYLRALKLWEILRQREPAHAEARRMSDAIELWLSRPRWFRHLPYLLGAIGLVALAILAFTLTGSDTPKPKFHNVPPGTNAPVIEPAPSENVVPPPTSPAPTPPPAIKFPESRPSRRR